VDERDEKERGERERGYEEKIERVGGDGSITYSTS
jgi:hypothetical protein